MIRRHSIWAGSYVLSFPYTSDSRDVTSVESYTLPSKAFSLILAELAS